jgi:hypothetical protein
LADKKPIPFNENKGVKAFNESAIETISTITEKHRQEVPENIAKREQYGVKYDEAIQAIEDYRSTIADEYNKESPDYAVVTNMMRRYMFMLEQKRWLQIQLEMYEDLVDKTLLFDNKEFIELLNRIPEAQDEVLQVIGRNYVLGDNVVGGAELFQKFLP